MRHGSIKSEDWLHRGGTVLTSCQLQTILSWRMSSMMSIIWRSSSMMSSSIRRIISWMISSMMKILTWMSSTIMRIVSMISMMRIVLMLI